MDQLDTINGWLTDMDKCAENRDSLYSQIANYEKFVSTQKLASLSLQRQINLQSNIIIEKDTIITNYRDICIGKDKQIKGLKFQRGILLITSGILGVITIIRH